MQVSKPWGISTLVGKKKRKNKRKKGQPDIPTWTKKIIMPIPFLFYCHHFSARSEDSKTAIPKRRTEEKWLQIKTTLWTLSEYSMLTTTTKEKLNNFYLGILSRNWMKIKNEKKKAVSRYRWALANAINK